MATEVQIPHSMKILSTLKVEELMTLFVFCCALSQSSAFFMLEGLVSILHMPLTSPQPNISQTTNKTNTLCYYAVSESEEKSNVHSEAMRSHYNFTQRCVSRKKRSDQIEIKACRPIKKYEPIHYHHNIEEQILQRTLFRNSTVFS